MRTGIVFRLALVALITTATAGLKCGDGALDEAVGPSTKSLTGTWQGPIESLTLRLVLTDTKGTVTGTGTMTQDGVPFTLSIGGTSSDGTFTLEIAEAEHAPFTYTGSVEGTGSASKMTGVGNGSGFTNQPITLTRQ